MVLLLKINLIELNKSDRFKKKKTCLSVIAIVVTFWIALFEDYLCALV